MNSPNSLSDLTWPYIFAYTLPAWLIGVFIVAQTRYAHAMCDQVGFPQPRNQPFNSFFYLFAAKELIYGVILIALELQHEWRAVGIVLTCLCGGGFIDMLLSMSKGVLGPWVAFQKHGMMTVLGFCAAWQIMAEN